MNSELIRLMISVALFASLTSLDAASCASCYVGLIARKPSKAGFSVGLCCRNRLLDFVRQRGRELSHCADSVQMCEMGQFSKRSRFHLASGDDSGKHGCMIHAEDVSAGHRGRRQHRSMAEKRRIVEQTYGPGRERGTGSAGQRGKREPVFAWRRAFKRGGLVESVPGSTALLPVVICCPTQERQEEEQGAGTAEAGAGAARFTSSFPGGPLISVERGADPALLRCVLESLRK